MKTKVIEMSSVEKYGFKLWQKERTVPQHFDTDPAKLAADRIATGKIIACMCCYARPGDVWQNDKRLCALHAREENNNEELADNSHSAGAPGSA